MDTNLYSTKGHNAQGRFGLIEVLIPEFGLAERYTALVMPTEAFGAIQFNYLDFSRWFTSAVIHEHEAMRRSPDLPPPIIDIVQFLKSHLNAI